MINSHTTIEEKLSNREFEVLELLSNGLTREAIASEMNISKLTYDSYRKNIRIKLGIRNQMDWGRIIYTLSL